MKFNKIMKGIICISLFSFSSISFANEDLISKALNQESYSQNIIDKSEEVKKMISDKYNIIEKFNPNFKVSYLTLADIYEIDLDEQKAYTNSEVSYLYLKGQVFVNENGKILNLTLNPKDFIKNDIKNNNEQNNSKKINASAQLNNNIQEEQRTHDTFNKDEYLKSLSGSSNINELKISAMLDYIGSENPQKIPDSSTDYIKNIDLTNAAKIVYGNGKRIMIMFADPDCPYCQNFENTMTVNSDKLDMTLYVLPWALDIHKNAQEKIDLIWSQEDPGQAWKSWMTFAHLNPELVSSDTAWSEWIKKTGRVKGEKSKAPMEVTNNFVKEFGLRYTPTTVFPNGAASEGDVDIDKLLSFLSVSEKGINK